MSEIAPAPIPDPAPTVNITPGVPDDVNLYAVLGFAHKGQQADMFVMGIMARTQEEATAPVMAHNDRIHPVAEGWQGHTTAASILGDDLILQAARIILQKPAYARGSFLPQITEQNYLLGSAPPPPAVSQAVDPQFAAPANEVIFNLPGGD